MGKNLKVGRVALPRRRSRGSATLPFSHYGGECFTTRLPPLLGKNRPSSSRKKRLERFNKNCGRALKAGGMVPRGFGLRQPSAAFPPSGRQRTAAEGCRS